MAINIELGRFKFAIGKSNARMSEIGATGTQVFSGFVNDDYLNALNSVTKKVDVYDKMRRGDGMVKAVLMAFELTIQSAEWFVEGEDDEQVEFITEALFKRMSISFNEFMHHVLLMLPFGFSIFEKVFKLEDNHIWWKKLAPRLPQSLYKWHLDEDGGLAGIQQWVQKGIGRDFKFIDIDIKDLLVFSFMREGSNFEGMSILRSAYKHWYVKDMLIKVSGIGLERQAVGFPVVSVVEGGSFGTADKKALENLVKKIRVNEESGAVLPPGFELKFLKGEVKAKDCLEHIRYHDQMIGKSALADFLNLGGGKTGSFALSKDQSEFFMMGLGSVCKYIAETVNRFAIPQLIDFNKFTVKNKNYPRLNYTVGKIDKEKLVEGMAKMIEKQVLIPEDVDEVFIRNLLSLPEIEQSVLNEREEDERKRQEDEEGDGIPKGDEDTIEASTRNLKHKCRRRRIIVGPIKLAESGFWRNPTKLEERVKLKDLDNKFTSAERAMIADLSIVADVQIGDLARQIEKAIASGRLNDLFKLTVRHRGDYAETLRGYMKDLAEFGKKTAEGEVNVTVDQISAKLKNWFTVKADTIVELHAAKLKANAMLTTLDSVNAGKSAKGILFDVKTSMRDFVDRELKATASITVNESINQGRNEIIRSGKIKAAQFSAILDRRTCPLCRELDGQIIDVENPDFDRFTPPIHSNCRCIWVYVHEEEENVKIDWSTPSQDLINRNGQLVP